MRLFLLQWKRINSFSTWQLHFWAPGFSFSSSRFFKVFLFFLFWIFDSCNFCVAVKWALRQAYLQQVSFPSDTRQRDSNRFKGALCYENNRLSKLHLRSPLKPSMRVSQSGGSSTGQLPHTQITDNRFKDALTEISYNCFHWSVCAKWNNERSVKKIYSIHISPRFLSFHDVTFFYDVREIKNHVREG